MSRGRVWHRRTASLIIEAALSCTLLLSFGLHAIELSHVHPGDHVQHAHENSNSSEDTTVYLGEYLHGTEKKSFLFFITGFLIAGLLFVATFLRANKWVVSVHRFCLQTRTLLYLYRQYCYLCLLLRKGVLNPKYY